MSVDRRARLDREIEQTVDGVQRDVARGDHGHVRAQLDVRSAVEGDRGISPQDAVENGLLPRVDVDGPKDSVASPVADRVAQRNRRPGRADGEVVRLTHGRVNGAGDRQGSPGGQGRVVLEDHVVVDLDGGSGHVDDAAAAQRHRVAKAVHCDRRQQRRVRLELGRFGVDRQHLQRTRHAAHRALEINRAAQRIDFECIVARTRPVDVGREGDVPVVGADHRIAVIDHECTGDKHIVDRIDAAGQRDGRAVRRVQRHRAPANRAIDVDVQGVRV